MHMDVNKKVLALVAIVVMFLFAITFMDSDEETYVAEVKASLTQIDGVAEKLKSIDAAGDKKALLAAYDEIIEVATHATRLSPPSTMQTFNKELKAYMKATKEGYELIRSGTVSGDASLVSQGILLLSDLDPAFINEIR